ncbi:alpha-ketoacid dehydrogenase subunit beta [Peristeroidobacter agariperforans]|uniref:alpha-ketoacid dehydrogenase subunit beta n=1 Tax=Peristeroidobacter agariperforans TaxID=268404 RepID=UPI00101C22F3|nr:alpha-ketoacid dehydrogenase subunit beta [Peristeroidobacter agariperforans]
MPQITYLEAAKSAIVAAMRRDPHVFVMGEDVQGFYYSDVLQEFGPERIRDTPISEAGFIGAGIGAALTGMRPVIEAAFSTFLYSAMDQIVNQAAKSRYMFGGQASVPIVVRSSVAYGAGLAAHHSDRPWGIFAQIPGLKIIVPTTPYDIKGLLKTAIDDNNPVLCFEDAALGEVSGEVPDHEYQVPFGAADTKRVGSDVTVVAIAGCVDRSLQAARVLEHESISVEVIDPRTLVPLDRGAIVQSVRKTGRLVVVDPAPGMCSVASEIAALVSEEAFAYLRAPVQRLTAPDVPVPFSPQLEGVMYPTAEGIAAAVRATCNYSRRNPTAACAPAPLPAALR